MKMTKAERLELDLSTARSLFNQARWAEGRQQYERIIESLRPKKKIKPLDKKETGE